MCFTSVSASPRMAWISVHAMFKDEFDGIMIISSVDSLREMYMSCQSSVVQIGYFFKDHSRAIFRASLQVMRRLGGGEMYVTS